MAKLSGAHDRDGMSERIKDAATLVGFAGLMAGVLTGLAALYGNRGWFTTGGPVLLVLGLLGAYLAASLVLVPPRARVAKVDSRG